MQDSHMNFFYQVTGVAEYALNLNENKTYTSIRNRIYLQSTLLSPTDWFQCNWTAITIPPTTDFKRKFIHIAKQKANTTIRFYLLLVCRDGEATVNNGTIQPLSNNVLVEDNPNSCRFTIIAPSNKRVQLFCPVINNSANDSQVSIVVSDE